MLDNLEKYYLLVGLPTGTIIIFILIWLILPAEWGGRDRRYKYYKHNKNKSFRF